MSLVHDRRLPLASVVLLAIIMLAPSSGAQQQAASDTPVEPSLAGLSAELLTVQNSLQNARVKLKQGIVSSSTPGVTTGDDRPDTPGFRCCLANMQRIDASLRRVLVHIDGLARRSAAAEDEIALGQLELIHDGVMGLGQGLQAFAGSADRRRAEAALAGMIRPFNMATSAMRGLSTCCAEQLGPLAEPSDVDDAPSSKKKKRKRAN